jgi:hypothetical protein
MPKPGHVLSPGDGSSIDSSTKPKGPIVMRRTAIFFLILGTFLILATNAFADQRAEAILKEVRTAIGGEELIQTIQSLAINAKYTRVLGDRQLSGEREISIGLPNQFLVEDAFTMGGLSTSMISTRGLNGESAWSSSSGGSGNMVIRMGGPSGTQASPEQIEAMIRQQYAAEMTRYLLATLAATPTAGEFKYVGDSDVDGTPVDVLEVPGPNKVAIRIFVDKKTHLPLLLSYRGPKPRIVTMSRPGGGAMRTDEEIRKAREEAEKKANTEAPAVPEQVDFFIRIENHKKVNGLVLPHKLTFLTDTEVSEEVEISKYQLNAQFKADKFQKH